MDRKWNLDHLYKGFDGEFIKDVETLKELLENMNKYYTLEGNEENLINYLKDDNQLTDLVEKLFKYVHLVMSADTSDMNALKYVSRLEDMLADFAEVQAKIKKWIAGIDFETMNNKYIKEHIFYLKEIKDNNRYLLDDKSEAVLAAMKTTGSSSWLKYKDQLISTLSVSIDNKDYALTEVLNMAYSKDKDIRKKAYEAELASYPKVEQGVVSALNAIKGEAITVAKMRGYDSVLDRTLKDSRMSKETLDALLETIRRALPMFEEYYQLKAKALGYTNGLPWYDMYAPIIEVETDYPYEKGSQFVIEQFSTFSKDLGNYAKRAIEENWIDVYPRRNKVGGAFCQNLHCIKESRFLLNYGNEFGDISTLAHELGHGYHGYCLDNEVSLNADYPMPIAETASTFSETIVKKAALKKAEKKESLMILESELSDCAQVIVDIYSRFLFESRFIEKRKDGPLSVEETKQLMLNAQKDAYGKGLDHNALHPYMWTWKPHYYEADYAFYNFPYAFGLLFAKALYGMYLKEGASFADKYKQLLSLTGKNYLEDVGKIMGIDMTSLDFWQNSIDMIKEDIELFKQLISEVL